MCRNDSGSKLKYCVLSILIKNTHPIAFYSSYYNMFFYVENEINALMEELYDAENHSQDDDSQEAPMTFNKPAPIRYML